MVLDGSGGDQGLPRGRGVKQAASYAGMVCRVPVHAYAADAGGRGWVLARIPPGAQADSQERDDGMIKFRREADLHSLGIYRDGKFIGYLCWHKDREPRMEMMETHLMVEDMRTIVEYYDRELRGSPG